MLLLLGVVSCPVHYGQKVIRMQPSTQQEGRVWMVDGHESWSQLRGTWDA